MSNLISRIIRRAWYWVLILFIYQFPSLFFITNYLGGFDSLIESRTGVEVTFKNKKWYPSVHDILEAKFDSDHASMTFAKWSLFKPWGSADGFIQISPLSHKDFNIFFNINEVDVNKLGLHRADYQWGSTYQEVRQNLIHAYSTDFKIIITAPKTVDLDNIKAIERVQ